MKSQRSLAQCIQSSGGLGEEVAARHFFTLVTAVQAKREEGVRWCKLTDRSIFMDEGGYVFLSLSSMRGGETEFMAPEQLRNARQTDGSDAWALGVLLWMMLDGALPDMPFGLQKEPLASFTERIPSSEECRSLLRATLERDPAKRASIETLAQWTWTIGATTAEAAAGGGGGASAAASPFAAAAAGAASASSPSVCLSASSAASEAASAGSVPHANGLMSPPKPRHARRKFSPRNPAASAKVGSKQPAKDNPLDPRKHMAFEAMVASVLHDKWRAQRKLMPDLTWEPRPKEVEGETYDIANLEYHELPEKFQTSNLMSARDACEAVMEAVSDNRIIDNDFVEQASDEQHQQWMRENGSWAPPELMVHYLELTEEEKQKDRDIVLEAIRLYKKLVPCLAIEIPLPPAPSMELAARQRIARERQQEADAAAAAEAAAAAMEEGGDPASPIPVAAPASTAAVRVPALRLIATARAPPPAPAPASPASSASPTTRGHLNMAAALQTQAKQLEAAAAADRAVLEEKHSIHSDRLSAQQINLTRTLTQTMQERDDALASVTRWQAAMAEKAGGNAQNSMLVMELQAAQLSKQMLEVHLKEQLREVKAAAAAAAAAAASATEVDGVETHSAKELLETCLTLRKHVEAARSRAALLNKELLESKRGVEEAEQTAETERAAAARHERSCATLRVARDAAEAASGVADAERANLASKLARVEHELLDAKAAAKQQEEESIELEYRLAATVESRKSDGSGAKALVGELQGKVASLQEELIASQKATTAERAAVETLGLRATEIVNLLEARLNKVYAEHETVRASHDAQVAELTAQLAAAQGGGRRGQGKVVAPPPTPPPQPPVKPPPSKPTRAKPPPPPRSGTGR